jgi:hypothetical protein
MFHDSLAKPALMSVTSALKVTDTDWSMGHPVMMPAAAGRGRGGATTCGAGGGTGGGPSTGGAPTSAMVYRSQWSLQLLDLQLLDYERTHSKCLYFGRSSVRCKNFLEDSDWLLRIAWIVPNRPAPSGTRLA